MAKISRIPAGLWTLLTCFLTLYAPIELTRWILVTSTDWSRPAWHFVAEIAFIWAAYLIGMVLVYKRR